MAQFTPKQINPNNINSGNEYTRNDNFSIDSLNEIVGGAIFVGEQTEAFTQAPDISEADIIGPASVELVDTTVNGRVYKKFKFKNLKGPKGQDGAMSMADILPYITSVYIPTKEEPVGSKTVFKNNPSFERAVVGEGITTINEEAFRDCVNLSEIKLPTTITTVGRNAFANTENYNNLSNWNGNDDILYIDGVLVKFGTHKNASTGLVQAPTIKEGTRVIADYAMNKVYSRNGVIFPNTLKYIGLEAFHYSNIGYGTNKIIIPDSVEEIGQSAFSSTQMTYIKIGNGLSTIPRLMLQNNERLTTVDFRGRTTVPTLQHINAFALVNSACKIVVPDALYDEWTTATNWNALTLEIVRESEYTGA